MLLIFFFLVILNSGFIDSLYVPIRARAEKDYTDNDVRIIVGTKHDSTEKFAVPLFSGQPSIMFTSSEPKWRASAYLISESGDAALKGAVLFSQYSLNYFVRVTVKISGLPVGRHAIDIHTFGDISRGCRSTGPHMSNTFVGNVEAKDDGEVAVNFYSSSLSLFGYRGIVGRSVLIHSNPIDVSHQPDVFSSALMVVPEKKIAISSEENTSGPPLMCGVITLTDDKEK